MPVYPVGSRITFFGPVTGVDAEDGVGDLAVVVAASKSD